jgi:predicted nucleic acid-binding protein
MTVVSDTGPLIALAKVDRLSLLEQLFEHVFIPPIVHRELLAKSGPESARLDNALLGFVEVTQVSSLAPEVKAATLRLTLVSDRQWHYLTCTTHYC